MIVLLCCFAFLINRCVGVIYHLNDSEYNRMPALFALDDYQSCMSNPEGLYCLAQFDLHSDQSSELITLIREYSEYKIKHYNHSHVERGICVTKTCKHFFKNKAITKEVDLRETLEKCFYKSLWEEYELKAKLSLVYYCDTYGEEKEIYLSDRIFISAIIFMLILNVAGNCYDIYVKKTERNFNGLGHAVLSSFSLRQNWKWFISYESENPKLERLKGLHGMRTITTLLTLLLHSLFTITNFIDNPHEVEKHHDKPFYYIIYNGLILMQLVFAMSGFLLTYNLQLRSENSDVSWKSFPKIIFLRLCRIVPAYAVVLFFTSTWFRHLGSGPLWKLFVTGVVNDCRKHWWQHLLFINNYTNKGDSFCLMQTWHLATEMQLFVVGLVLHLTTRRYGRRILLAFMLLVGAVAPAIHVLLQDVYPLVIINPESCRANQNDTYYMMHILGHNNLAGHVVGMITGYLVYHMQENGKLIGNYKIFSLLTWFMWCALPVSIYVFWLGSIFYIDGYEVSLAFKLLYAATHRVLAGSIATSIIFGLVFRLNDTLCSILEWRGWVIPSRLSYAVLLVHMNIVSVILGTKTQLGHSSTFFALLNYFGIATMSFLLALPFYLTVEAPINKMVKRITDQREEQYSKMKKT